MNKWVLLIWELVITSLIGLFASYVALIPTGQVVATLASVNVAAIGLLIFFHKSKQ